MKSKKNLRIGASEMGKSTSEKKKRKLPEDALKHGGRHLMQSIFGDEVMAEVDKVVSERSKEKKDVE